MKQKLEGYVINWGQQEMSWLKDAVNRFELDKRTLRVEDAADYMVSVVGLPGRVGTRHGIKNNSLPISSKDIREKIFDKLVTPIRGLIRDQVGYIRRNNGRVKAVLLVGGFGNNVYLRKQIEYEVGREVKVEKVMNSDTAIARGALMYGLAQAEHKGERSNRRQKENEEEPRPGMIKVRVTSRLAPRNFGVKAWEPLEDDEATRQARRLGFNVKPDMDGKMGKEVMNWFVRKGEQITNRDSRSFELTYDGYETKDAPAPSKITCDVYACDDDIPPENPKALPTLKPLVTPKIDLKARLPTKMLNHKAFYKADFDVNMTVESAKLTFFLVKDGVRYEAQEVTFY